MPVDELIRDIGSTGYSFVLVNDGSRDNTLEILQDISNKYPEQVKVIDQQPNKGKAEAVRTGMLEAIKWQNFEYVGFMDADLATPVSEMNYLLDIAGEKNFDMIFGSRVKRLGVDIDRKLTRHLIGRIIATFISNILKLPTYDTQCGAKIFKSGLAGKIFSEEFLSRWLFDVEIFFRLKKIYGGDIHSKVHEAPLNVWSEKGEYKVSVWYFFKIPFELFRIKRKYSKKKFRMLKIFSLEIIHSHMVSFNTQ